MFNSGGAAQNWASTPEFFLGTLSSSAGQTSHGLAQRKDAERRETLLQSKRRASRWIIRSIWALSLLIVIYCFVLQPGMVPTGSMENTVLIGDHLLLWKLPYGPQAPFTPWRLPRLRTPQTGEIVAFRSPEDASDIYLKRVIAVAGDTVEIHRGTLFVNSVPVPESYARVRANRRSSWQENILPERVPAGEIFVLGDNRDNSEDSRYFGPVPADSVVGEPVLVFWSYDAPSSAWLDPNPLHQARLYASALEHVITQTRWRRTGLLLVLK